MNRLAKILSLIICTGISRNASALIINPVFNSNTSNSIYSAQIQSAFNTACSYVQSIVTNDITVNIGVYWGGGGPFSTNVGLGEAQFPRVTLNYPQLTNALRAARSSAADSNAVASLPASDPAPGKTWQITRAQAKAFGGFGISANDSTNDGNVAFSPAYTFAFDPTNRAVSGAFDFIGVAIHEITEVLGRSDDYLDANFFPLDLFRFSAPGALALSNTAPVAYFSVDGGVTKIRNFNTNTAGDPVDWAADALYDCCDWIIYSSQKEFLGHANFVALDVVGFKVNYSPPSLRLRKQNSEVVMSCTNVPGTVHVILVSTNLSLPLANWSILASNSDRSTPGNFQFTNTIAGSNLVRFYRVKVN